MHLFLKEDSKDFWRVNGLIFLLSEFEFAIKRTLDLTFSIKPEILKNKEKVLTYEEVLGQTEEEVYGKIIDKELEMYLNLDIKKMGEYLKDTFSCPITENSDWLEFCELFYRRNLLVHNRGKVNDVYRNKTQTNPSRQYLTVDEEYLKRTLELLHSYAHKIIEFLSDKYSKFPPSKLHRHEVICDRLPGRTRR